MNLRQVALATALFAAGSAAWAGDLLSEGFDDVSTLAGTGWVLQNLSTSGGTTSWFQGDVTTAFTAHSGADNSYIAANFNNAPVGGTISNWLITPELSLAAATTISLQVRNAGEGFLDTIEVYYSANGASTSVGDFTLLGTYASTQDQGWTALSYDVAAAGGTGRFAVRYFVGDTSLDGNYIGIDSLSVSAVPEPASAVLAGLGLAVIGIARRRQQQA